MACSRNINFLEKQPQINMAGSRISQRSSSDVLSGDNRIHDVNALQEIQQPQSGHGPVASQPGPACCEARRKPPSFTETFRRAPSKAHKTPAPAASPAPAPAPSRSLFRSRSLPLSLSLSVSVKREGKRVWSFDLPFQNAHIPILH